MAMTYDYQTRKITRDWHLVMINALANSSLFVKITRKSKTIVDKRDHSVIVLGIRQRELCNNNRREATGKSTRQRSRRRSSQGRRIVYIKQQRTTMKVTIELTDRIIDAVNGIMMMQAIDSDKEEQQLSDAIDHMKQMTEPLLLNTDIMSAKDGRQVLIGIGCLALTQVLRDMDRE